MYISMYVDPTKTLHYFFPHADVYPPPDCARLRPPDGGEAAAAAAGLQPRPPPPDQLFQPGADCPPGRYQLSVLPPGDRPRAAAEAPPGQHHPEAGSQYPRYRCLT